ncbi:glycosyltransferase family 39 protein [Acidihalobacter yilgarnensis]|uniref:glycosyltransferase family 39 protein n=1 Tax=Acidihalobacter yilgarnensis TaxID=2819280 RepID=UPI000AF271BA|nr:glycosyltransferase family 39 protein [Acidihalobacter yilgarnensis]
MSRHSPNLNATQATALLLGLVTLLHIIAGARVGLTGDAAHYAVYGARLAWSYFDHPPMIGWLQATIEPFSTDNLALRLWPIALGTASGAALYRLARQLYPERSPWLGFVAVAVMQSAIILSLMGISMLPDDPLLLFFLLAAGALHRALIEDRPRAWLWVGLWFGLAALSKYTAVALVFSAVWLMISERRWAQLRTPWPWLGILIALIAILPVLGWNATHDWVSFRYQILHVSDPERHWLLANFVKSQLIQIFSYSPGIYVFGLIALIHAVRRRHDPRNRLLLAMVVPVFVIIDGASGTNVSLPHWPAVGWAVLSIGIATWLSDHRTSRWLQAGVVFSGLYSVLLIGVLLSELIHPWIPFKANAYPLADLYGWRRAADHAEILRAAMAETPGPRPLLYAGNWSYASHIAWYAYPQPVQITDHKMHQMTLWYGNAAAGGRGILVIPQQFHGRIPTWTAKFDRCTPAGNLLIPLERKIATTYYFYRCEGYHG